MRYEEWLNKVESNQVPEHKNQTQVDYSLYEKLRTEHIKICGEISRLGCNFPLSDYSLRIYSNNFSGYCYLNCNIKHKKNDYIYGANLQYPVSIANEIPEEYKVDITSNNYKEFKETIAKGYNRILEYYYEEREVEESSRKYLLSDKKTFGISIHTSRNIFLFSSLAVPIWMIKIHDRNQLVLDFSFLMFLVFANSLLFFINNTKDKKDFVLAKRPPRPRMK